jgi:uracil-DNA glycosylase
MLDTRRKAYLDAMGVQVFVRRAAASAEVKSEAAPAERSSVNECSSGPVGTVIEKQSWADLQQSVASCKACDLHQARTRTVFGVGNPSADLLVIGEAPGAEEDRQGEPFVGRAGQLLTSMLQAIGVERAQVFIANILKCRPPNNRNPSEAEVAHCLPFLMRQIALIQPRLIVSLGAVSAQNLLSTKMPVGRLRGQWHQFGDDKIPLIVTYHPAYLLRSPAEKAKAWQDLLLVKHRLETE